MKPSAKRALLLPAWRERRLYWQVAGFFARGLLPLLEELGRGVGPFFGPARRDYGAVDWRWEVAFEAVGPVVSGRWGEGRDGAAMTAATGAQQAQGMRRAAGRSDE